MKVSILFFFLWGSIIKRTRFGIASVGSINPRNTHRILHFPLKIQTSIRASLKHFLDFLTQTPKRRHSTSEGWQCTIMLIVRPITWLSGSDGTYRGLYRSGRVTSLMAFEAPLVPEVVRVVGAIYEHTLTSKPLVNHLANDSLILILSYPMHSREMMCSVDQKEMKQLHSLWIYIRLVVMC